MSHAAETPEPQGAVDKDPDAAEEEFAVEEEPGPSAVDPGFSAIAKYFEAEREREENLYGEYARRPEYSQDLLSAFESYSRKIEFAPGALVQWKPLLRNQQFPQYGRPAVVIELLSEPIMKRPDRGAIAEPLDMVIGYLDGDQDFVAIQVSSRRLAPWPN